jgi:hypothetical protein
MSSPKYATVNLYDEEKQDTTTDFAFYAQAFKTIIVLKASRTRRSYYQCPSGEHQITYNPKTRPHRDVFNIAWFQALLTRL